MSNAAIDIDRLTEGFVEPTEEQEREAFLRSLGDEAGIDPENASRVEADLYLDHLLEKLAGCEAEIAQNNEIAERRILMVEGWRMQQNRTPERNIQWLKMQVQAIAEGYDFGSKKSRSLPNGTFGFRSTPEKIEILDMDRAVAFAEANGLEVKKTVNRTPLKTHFKATGEVPDGAEVVPGQESFFVKAGS